MLKKIPSNKLYALTDNEKRTFTSFEDDNTYWDKNNRCFNSSVPNYIITLNSKELFTGVKINIDSFNNIEEGLFADKHDTENVSLKDFLSYLKLIGKSNDLFDFLYHFQVFEDKSIKTSSPQRVRK